MPNTISCNTWEINPQLPPIPLTDILGEDGTLRARIEHYINGGPDHAHAIQQFQERMKLLSSDVGHYRTVVVDSISFLQDAAVQYQRLVNPYTQLGNVDPRKWYANAKEAVQEELMARLAWLRDQNVVLIAHASEKTMEFGDDVVRGIDAIGKLAGRLGQAYGEVYHAYVQDVVDDKGRPTGEEQFLLQTKTNAKWGALTLINAPNPCPSDWNRLWDGGAPVRPLRCIVYGAFGTGKTRFAATWPTPMLVLGFDPYAKLEHYNQAGAST